jgi:hypothetical protein
MLRPISLSLLIVLSATLAGCAGGPDEATNQDTSHSVAPPAEFDETTGAIRGVVLDPELLPVADAQVQLDQDDFETTTAADGSFSLSHVPPGTYTLYVAKLGYESVARATEVTAGRLTEDVSFTLEPLPVVEPFSRVEKFEGFITCSIGYEAVLSEECGQGLQTPVGTFGRDPNNRIDWAFNVTTTENLVAIYLELDWDAATAAAQQLAFNVAHGFTCIPSCGADITYCGAFDNFGQAVQSCHLETGDLGIDDPATQLPWDITARAWAAPSPATDPPNIVLQQSFTMYRTEFYGLGMTEGYSAVPDQ